MTNLIDIQDFVFPYKIIADNSNTQNRVNEIISYAQRILLYKILGNELYWQFENEYIEPIPEKWDKFVNGHTYTINSAFHKYNGVKFFLPMLVYFYIQNDIRKQPGSMVDLQLLHETGTQVYDRQQIAQIYNEGAKYVNKETYDFLTLAGYDFKFLNFRHFKPINPIF